MSDPLTRIAENLREVRGRMAEAARRSGRAPGQVALVAVTKYVGPEAARTLVEAGCADLGESRPQELWQKAEALAGLPIRWHLVGHLQRNKVRRTLPLMSLLHSGDSLRLLAAVDEAAGALGRPAPVLLEVNVSGEPAKHGFASEQIEPLWDQLTALRNVEVHGLMGMAGLEGGLEAARRQFAMLRRLRDRLRAAGPQGAACVELSMGMSADYEVAVEEGATIVRIGSALFEGVGP